MNRLHSFLFSLLFLATLSCSASEQSITRYNDTQLSTIKIIHQRSQLTMLQSRQSSTNFINNANTLKNNLENTGSLSLENNELRLMMAENLKPIIQQRIFVNRLLEHVQKTPYKQSHRLNYLDTVQEKLRNINELTITIEEIEQYEIVVDKIVRPTCLMSFEQKPSADKWPQIYGEIVEEEERCRLLFPSTLDTDASEENKEIINCLTEFLKIIHQEEATKK